MAVGTRTTSMVPTAIVTFDVRTPNAVKEITDVNADILQGKKLATTEEIWYQVRGRFARARVDCETTRL